MYFLQFKINLSLIGKLMLTYKHSWDIDNCAVLSLREKNESLNHHKMKSTSSHKLKYLINSITYATKIHVCHLYGALLYLKYTWESQKICSSIINRTNKQTDKRLHFDL